MGLISVYKADVQVGPNVWGEVYSFRPIPDCVYPATDAGIDGHSVEFSWCTRFVIETPDQAAIVAYPPSGIEGIPDPERPDGFITLGPRVVLDPARRDDGFKLIRIYWRYWRNERSPTESRRYVGSRQMVARPSLSNPEPPWTKEFNSSPFTGRRLIPSRD